MHHYGFYGDAPGHLGIRRWQSNMLRPLYRKCSDRTLNNAAFRL